MSSSASAASANSAAPSGDAARLLCLSSNLRTWKQLRAAGETKINFAKPWFAKSTQCNVLRDEESKVGRRVS